MGHNWPVKKLGQVANCQDGDWILSKDLATGNKVRLIQLGDIGEGKFLDKTSKYISEERCKKLKCTLLNSGDILLARLGEPLGKACIFPRFPYPCITAVDVTIIRPKKFMDRDFLHNYLNSKIFKDQVNSVSTGATRKRISRKNLENLEIPLPPIEEQKRIVKKLEKILARIEEAHTFRNESTGEIKKVMSSAFQKIFSSLISKSFLKKLSECSKFIDYRGKTPYKTNEGLRLITAKNVRQGYLSDSPKEYVSPDIYESWMTRGIPNKGDVLFTTEAPLGNVAQLNTDDKVMFAQRVIVLQAYSDINSSYLKYALMSNPIQNIIQSQATGLTAQGIKASKLKTVKIPVPDLKEQGKIVAYLDGLSEKVQALQKFQQEQLQELELLKQSVLHRAFEEEL